MVGLFICALVLWASTTDGARPPELTWDPKGYVMFGTNVGSYGMKIDQVLGMLNYAKQLDRTLVVPNIWRKGTWRHGGKVNDFHHPYSENFSAQRLGLYHRVVEFEDFMRDLADQHWALNKRFKFCRRGECQYRSQMWLDHDFEMKWIGSVKMKYTKVDYIKDNFPPEDFPVLTFPGAHTHYPLMAPNEVKLYKYFDFSPYIVSQTNKFFKDKLIRPVLAVHLRIGKGFVKTCTRNIGKSNPFYNSRQCLSEDEPMRDVHCSPSDDYIAYVIVNAATRLNSQSVFIGIDHWRNNLKAKIQMGLDQLPNKPKIVVQPGDRAKTDQVLDISIMSNAEAFIGNCLSSFTGLVNRYRETNNKPVHFMGIGEHDPFQEEVDTFALYNNRLLQRARGHDEL